VCAVMITYIERDQRVQWVSGHWLAHYSGVYHEVIHLINTHNFPRWRWCSIGYVKLSQASFQIDLKRYFTSWVLHFSEDNYNWRSTVPLFWYGTVKLNYNFTIPRVNFHGSPQCHGWLLLRGISVPRLFVYFVSTWNNAIFPYIIVKPCTWSTRLLWWPKFWKSKLRKTALPIKRLSMEFVYHVL